MDADKDKKDDSIDIKVISGLYEGIFAFLHFIKSEVDKKKPDHNARSTTLYLEVGGASV